MAADLLYKIHAGTLSNYLKSSQISAKPGPKQHSLLYVFTMISMAPSYKKNLVGNSQ